MLKEYEKKAKIVASLYGQLPQVTSVVIGGSLARHFSDLVSDIEMYVYYDETMPSEEEIHGILKKLKAKLTRSKKIHWYHPAWGYHTFFNFDGVNFELGYRDINNIRKRMEDFKSRLILPKHGIHDTPFGHYESGIASCIVECKPVIDKKNKIKKLKDYLKNYKNTLIRQKTFDYYIKDAEIILEAKAKYAVLRNDNYNFNSCTSRALRSLVIALFALNSTYYPGDKWNGKYLNKFKLKPKNYDERVDRIFSLPDFTKDNKQEKLAELMNLTKETKTIYKKEIRTA